MDLFPKEKVTHAKYFRHPSAYKNKNVLLVGNGPSGADLANQLLNYAQSIQRSVRSEPNPLAVTNPKVRDVAAIKSFTKDTIELVDGTKVTGIDTVIYCTGYLYSLPMFPKEAGFITADGLYVHHLYQHTFYAEDPTLVFLGLMRQVVPFPLFQNQSICAAKVWAKKLFLPSREIMRKEEFERLEQQGFEAAKYHSFKFPEDIELSEKFRRWIEEDRSEGWENSMKPSRWTEKKSELRKNARELKIAFLKEIEEGRWNHMMLDRP